MLYALLRAMKIQAFEVIKIINNLKNLLHIIFRGTYLEPYLNS